MNDEDDLGGWTLAFVSPSTSLDGWFSWPRREIGRWGLPSAACLGGLAYTGLHRVGTKALSVVATTPVSPCGVRDGR